MDSGGVKGGFTVDVPSICNHSRGVRRQLPECLHIPIALAEKCHLAGVALCELLSSCAIIRQHTDHQLVRTARPLS